MMKRILTMTLALTLAMALLLCGCGGKDAGPTDNNKDKFQTAGIHIGGATLNIGGRLTDEIKTTLGDPISTSEAPSCLYEGMDTVYEYEGFSLQTSQMGDSEVVVMITIESADHTTAKGVKIGDTAAAAATAYGEAVEETKNYVVYRQDGNVTVTFSLKDGKITAIEYAQAAA